MPSNLEHEKKFGPCYGGSRWYEGDPEVISTEVKTYREVWKCPAHCGGEMQYTGYAWGTAPPGHHHVCNNNKCGFRAVPRNGECFPRTVAR